MPAAPSSSVGRSAPSGRGLGQRLLAWEEGGPLSLSLLAGDAAVAAWLAFACFAFTDRPRPAAGPLALGVAGVALLAHLARLHARPIRLIGGLAARAGGFAVLLGAALYALRAIGWLDLPPAALLWLVLATAVSCFVLRLAFSAVRARHPDQPLEMLRWVALAGAGTALFLPYYQAGAVGTGDAQWYVVMLADFVTQLRAGVFPVWAGQSVYAFNGAVSPLRFAPWYQHAGGLLDLLTARALGFGALSNAVLAVNGLASGFVAYFCLRDMLPRRPGLACLLALLFVSSPGILAPLLAGDQYMTFMATPFIPVVLSGVYRCRTREDSSGPLRLAVGLAGTWLSHAPVALWCTLLAVATVGVELARRRQWRGDLRRLLPAGIAFLILGSLPFLSLLALDNLNPAKADGVAAALQIRACFPANFAPIQPTGDKLVMYQVGYAALGALVLAIAFLPKQPPRGTWWFFGATLALGVLVLPVPLLNRFFWTQVPVWFVTINNVWPMQRVFGIGAGLMLFSFAVVFGDARIANNRWVCGACLILLGALGLWAGHEARKLQRVAWASYRPPAALAAALDPRNVVLSRYAYATFAFVPAYLSHGYVDPLLENRLLAHDTLALMTANADRAAPPVRADAGSSAVPRLRQTGTLTAERTAGGDSHLLTPALSLGPGRRHALRLEFFETNEPGVLLLTGSGLFREYLLPDSGLGLDHRGPPRAFGATATSSKVIALAPADPGQDVAALHFVPDGYSGRKRYAFGRFWLYEFRPDDLAVVVKSWLPYHATVATAAPAYLETPRLWLGGYRATVNGRPAATKRSPDNLVMVELPPGANDVVLTYQAPWWLRLSFWSGVCGWCGAAAVGLRRLVAAARV
jgi:hypothetical protein